MQLSCRGLIVSIQWKTLTLRHTRQGGQADFLATLSSISLLRSLPHRHVGRYQAPTAYVFKLIRWTQWQWNRWIVKYIYIERASRADSRHRLVIVPNDSKLWKPKSICRMSKKVSKFLGISFKYQKSTPVWFVDWGIKIEFVLYKSN
jgi:hypothetical protein